MKNPAFSLQATSFKLKIRLTYGILLIAGTLAAQCSNQITHLSGTELVNCSEVTVTSAGAINNGMECQMSPYFIGNPVGTGSYTFSFSPPATGVTLGFSTLNNWTQSTQGYEEIAIAINGAPYFITDAGVPPPCNWQSMVNITAAGRLAAPMSETAGCDELHINLTINTITIEDRWVSGFPMGAAFAIRFCCGPCLTNAGVLGDGPLNLCPGATASFSAATTTYLETGDLLQYVLFTDLSDTIGSIKAVSNTPIFPFDPASMQESVTYYVAAVAGNNLNGNVDLTDLCIDFSNALEVVWWPPPSVSFSTDDTDICLGECTTVTATFTGNPPFTLTYINPLGVSNTQVFPSDNGTFQICNPLGSPAGSFLVKGTSLTDAFCTCQ